MIFGLTTRKGTTSTSTHSKLNNSKYITRLPKSPMIRIHTANVTQRSWLNAFLPKIGNLKLRYHSEIRHSQNTKQ